MCYRWQASGHMKLQDQHSTRSSNALSLPVSTCGTTIADTGAFASCPQQISALRAHHSTTTPLHLHHAHAPSTQPWLRLQQHRATRTARDWPPLVLQLSSNNH
jgi:hypothetical protein